MVTGVTTPWGYSPQAIANMTSSLNKEITNMLGLSSVPPTFVNGEYVSPMTGIQNAYNQVNFGKTKFGSDRRLFYVPNYPNQTWNKPCAPCAPCAPCPQRSVDTNRILTRLGASYNCHDRNEKKMVINGKTSVINSRAYFTQGEMGTIIGMGCKQILVLNGKGIVKRVGLEKFIQLNK